MTRLHRLIEDGSLSEKILVRFASVLTQTPQVIPRIASESRVKRVLLNLMAALKNEGYLEVAAARLIEHLQNAGLVHRLPIENLKHGVPRIFFLGIYSPAIFVDPVELLCAADSDRVICYFTAIAHYGLTTQNPVHHHAARLREYSSPFPPRPSSVAKGSQVSTLSAEPRASDPLGTRLFDYQNLPYYLTQRDRRLVPGIQRRQMGAAGTIRITTLEQTLLDTLHKPLSCGGPAVVFEAWENGISKLNQERLATLLAAIDDDVRARRVGWMFERQGFQYKRGSLLASIFEAALNGVKTVGMEHQIPSLLPGVAYDGIDEKWGLQVPA